MKLACPSCQHPLTVDTVGAELSTEIGCATCHAVVGITVATTILDAGSLPNAQGPARNAVVALADRALRNAYGARLVDAGWRVRQCGDGREALQMMAHEVPDVAVIDGGFPPIFGMGVGEIIKKSGVTRRAHVLGLRADGDDLLPMPGADRTLPLTAGADVVADAALRLLAGTPAERPAPPAAHAARPVDDAHTTARRLARIILSDIVLYNQALFDDAVRGGRLRQVMNRFLEEGREHYAHKVDPALAATTHYLDEAVERYIAARERSLDPVSAGPA
jgi:DNA-binding NarL/FixJ family response regulator